nr:hypothetical protein [Tanacetum cinerariifolium]
MEDIAILAIALIFAASSFTVLITLCYKGDNDGGSHYHKRYHNNRIVIALRAGQKSCVDLENGGVVKADRDKNVVVAATTAATTVKGGGGGGGSSSGG